MILEPIGDGNFVSASMSRRSFADVQSASLDQMLTKARHVVLIRSQKRSLDNETKRAISGGKCKWTTCIHLFDRFRRFLEKAKSQTCSTTFTPHENRREVDREAGRFIEEPYPFALGEPLVTVKFSANFPTRSHSHPMKSRHNRWLARNYDWMTRRYEQWMGARKTQLFSEAVGQILELGYGTGANLKYLSNGTGWIGIDVNQDMAREAFEKQNSSTCKESQLGTDSAPPLFTIADAARLPIRDASIDAVICTLVLCSVPQPRQALAEVLRVLRPGGCFLFVEHVKSPKRSAQWMQSMLQPFWRICADGCRLNQDTMQLIDSAGFKSVIYEDFQVPFPVVPRFLRWHVSGMAIR